MSPKPSPEPPELSHLEARVMEILWNETGLTADEIRRRLQPHDDLTDSSVRTLLRRLEQKSYVAHDRDGKRFLFRAVIERPGAAAAAARRIVKTICGGAADSLVLGMIEARMLTVKELDRIRERLAREEEK